EVHGVGQILPRPCHTLHVRLPAEFSFGTHFAGYARHFRSERPQLIHHRVNGFLQLQNFPLHVYRDLLRRSPIRHLRRHGSYISPLCREVACHEVHRVRQVLPRTGDTFHFGLPTQLPFRTYFTSHARHFRRER